LRTFKVDLATTERLAARWFGKAAVAPTPSSPQPIRGSDSHPACSAPLLVAESGIHTRADVERLARCGAGAILVGESLMRQANLRDKVRELLGRGGG
jgi:indole-3-glycerol phosphate synthase